MRIKIPSFISMALILSVSLSNSEAIERKLPDTPQGQGVMEFFKAFNTGNEEIFTAFIQKNFSKTKPQKMSDEEMLRIFRRLYDDSGGFQYHDIFEAGKEKISVLAQDKLTERRINITFTFDTTPPYGINRLGLETASPPENIKLKSLTDEEVIQELESYLEKLVREDRFSGAVLLAKKGSLFSERPLVRPANDSIYRIKSIQNSTLVP